jgi:hypothetical protein
VATVRRQVIWQKTVDRRRLIKKKVNQTRPKQCDHVTNAGSYHRTPKIYQPIGNQGKEMKQPASHKIISLDLESNYFSVMSKQKNTNKCSQHKTNSLPAERIFTDIASIRLANGVIASKSHWCIKVDEFSQFKFSTFHAHKDEIVESSCELFQRWKQGDNPVKYVRCDNAGENWTLQKRANSVDWKLNLTFEFTPRDTPQHNHPAELGLASIASKGRSLMSAANIPMRVRYKVWVKVFQHATDMDGLVIAKINDKVATRYEHWCGKIPKWVNHL